MSFTCHSGGCPGSDMFWETEGEKHGVKTIAYSFWGHTQYGKNRQILEKEQLAEGFEAVLRANKNLKRNPEKTPRYIQNLLSRNWFQVKNSDAVFAIINTFLTETTVAGGTGWAVQMAIDCDKPVFVYQQGNMTSGWYRYMPVVGFESLRGEIPKLTKNFAGIGTRELEKSGKEAIQKIYEENIKKCLPESTN